MFEPDRGNGDAVGVVLRCPRGRSGGRRVQLVEDVPVDSIALMALADIPDGETVFLTDRGWQTSTNSLRPTTVLENTITG